MREASEWSGLSDEQFLAYISETFSGLYILYVCNIIFYVKLKNM